MFTTLAKLDKAAAEIYRTLAPTPQYSWPLLCEHAGCMVWVKHENHLPIGAFKVRGGLTYMAALKQAEPDCRGVISATRGNHGQSIAFAAAHQGMSAVIVVPHGNSREKNQAMRAWGAELIEHGEDFNDASDYAAQLAGQRGLHRVPSFHADLVKGVASYWLELFRAVPDLHTAYVPIGLGSGLCAGIVARNVLGLSTRLVGVVSSHAPTYALSWQAGAPVEHPSATQIGDGVAVRRPDPETLEMIRQGAERIVQVTDEEMKSAMRLYFAATHNVAEGAGAAALAALLQEREQMRGRNVAVILSGGNVDSDIFARVLVEDAS